MKKMTGKLARQPVKESHPQTVCRHGWNTFDGVRVDYYEILPSLRVSGHWQGHRLILPKVLGKGSTKAAAWIDAATKLIASMDAAA